MVAAAVEAGKAPFIGGEAPSAADLNVFGILRSIENFTTEKFMFERAPARGADTPREFGRMRSPGISSKNSFDNYHDTARSAK